MRVVVMPADRAGCGHYRCIFPAAAARAAGGDVTVTDNRPPTADVVVLQRPLREEQYRYQRALQANGVAVVVEVDDDLEALHPANHVTPIITGTSGYAHAHRKWTLACAADADLVTCTTPALAARYAPHGRVAVLPNYVPASYLTIRRPPPDGQVVVGWSGTVRNHPDDLTVTGGGVGAALRATRAVFQLIGEYPDVVAEQLGLDRPPALTPWQPVTVYPRALAALDVGIAPLTDTAFNRAKSWLKPLEMAAVGVPAVMSPVDRYLALHQRGVGLLAATPAAWRTQVTRLCRDDTLRTELSEAGREVAATLTYERHAERWLDAWTLALRNRDAVPV